MARQKQTPEERKEKAKWARIKRVYGITKEQYHELDTGYCPLCLRPWSDTVNPVVDHRHSFKSPETQDIHPGYVRGLLCRWCNKFVLGRLSDPIVVRRILSYLESAPTNLTVPEKKKKKRKKIGKNSSGNS